MVDPDPNTVLAGRRILVVEDEALVAMLIEDTLTDRTHPVKDAGDRGSVIRLQSCGSGSAP